MPGLIEQAWRWGSFAAVPVLRRMLRRRVARGKEVAERLGEREGLERMPRPEGRLVWIHAASVGESISMLPVLSSLARRAPELQVLFTTGTITSARLLEQRLPELGLAQVRHRFVPLDVRRWTERFLDHWRPDLAAFVESEIWPNLIAGCRARAIPMMLVNGRMSPASYRNWRRVPGFAGALIGAFDLVHAQSEANGERLRALGARAALPAGNLKWAAPKLPCKPAECERLRQLLQGRPVWLACSTHPGEEAIVADVHAALRDRHPGLLTMIAPRHPERAAEIAAALGGVSRRSCTDPPGASGLWVIDTMGELGLFYRLAEIVFMGGSLVRHGGQNPLEPARFACAIATGPHTANFAEIVERLDRAGGLVRVADGGALRDFVDAMLSEPSRARAMGAAAAEVADSEQGLPERIADAMLGLLAR